MIAVNITVITLYHICINLHIVIKQYKQKCYNLNPQGASALSGFTQWGAQVCSCCTEEQPVELKLMAASVLVNCTDSVLCSAHLPLGES